MANAFTIDQTFSNEKGLAHMVGCLRCARIEFDGAPAGE
jgi:hypothetical protein